MTHPDADFTRTAVALVAGNDRRMGYVRVDDLCYVLDSYAPIARSQRGCPDECGCTDCDMVKDLRALVSTGSALVAANDRVPEQRAGEDGPVSLTTNLAVEAVAWERAPRYPNGRVNLRIVCADGYTVSAQASSWHYANDSHPNGRAAYWRGTNIEAAHPFTTFEIGNPSDDPTPADVWDEYESGGVWAWVPRRVVADLLDAHGGAVAWEQP